MHESEIQAGAEVEADFQASCLVGLNSECMVVMVPVSRNRRLSCNVWNSVD